MPTKTASKRATKHPGKRASKPLGKLGKRPLTKQLLTVKYLLEGATLCAAMERGGYTKATARSQPASLVGPIREQLLQALKKQGVTPDAMAERLNAKMYAVSAQNIKQPDGSEITTVADDHGAQLRALELLSKILGTNAPIKSESKEEVIVKIEDRRKEQQGVWERLGGID